MILVCKDKNEIMDIFDAVDKRVPIKPMILIEDNKLFDYSTGLANERNIFCKTIKSENDFIAEIVSSLRVYLQKQNNAKAWLLATCLDELKILEKSFVWKDKIDGLSKEEKLFYISSNLDDILSNVLFSFGKLAQKMNAPICFAIEMSDHITKNESTALAKALIRVYQNGYPIFFIIKEPSSNMRSAYESLERRYLY